MARADDSLASTAMRQRNNGDGLEKDLQIYGAGRE